jgi:hypothetical protein
MLDSTFSVHEICTFRVENCTRNALRLALSASFLVSSQLRQDLSVISILSNRSGRFSKVFFSAILLRQRRIAS